MNSRRIIDCVMRGDNEEATRILRESLDRKQVEATLEQSVAIAYNAIHEKFRPTDTPNVDNAADAAAAAAEQGLPDPALDPAITKEFFLKSFEVDGIPVSLKKMGLGASAPISSFVGGERWEIFMTPQQATREVKKYITSGLYKASVDAANAAAAQAQKDAEAVEKAKQVKKESVELDEQMTFQFGTTEQASKFADEAVRQRLAAATDQYKSNYGDHMVELSSNSGSTGSPTMAHKSLVKLMKKHGGKLHSTNEGPRIKKVFEESRKRIGIRTIKFAKILSLSKDAKDVFASAINMSQTAGVPGMDAPLATAKNLQKFSDGDFVGALVYLRKNSSKLPSGGRKYAKEILDALGDEITEMRGEEDVRLDENVQNQVKRMDKREKQKLADKLNDLDLSGYGDYEARVDNVHKFKPSDLKMAMQMMSLKEEQLDEKIKGLENKSEKSGIAYGILKKVYDRGMEAWRSGHRPGATQHQWAFARVNSFITGGKTRTTADKDLWAQHKGKKESVQIDEAKKTYEFKDFKTADAFAKACDEIVDSSDLTVNKKKKEVTVEFRRRSDEMIIDSLAKDYEA